VKRGERGDWLRRRTTVRRTYSGGGGEARPGGDGAWHARKHAVGRGAAVASDMAVGAAREVRRQ
jgi:hypothetical protein